jgi:hypothetical protein
MSHSESQLNNLSHGNFLLSPALEFKPILQEDVESEFKKAEMSVSTVQSRYTNALKGVHDYAAKACEWLNNISPSPVKETQLANVLSCLEHLLSKIDKWKQPSSWFRLDERTAIINDNNMNTEQVANFDDWYSKVCTPFEDNSEADAQTKLNIIELHLKQRVAVESVKNYLRHRSEVLAVISPIVQKGFDLLSSGELPDGKLIPSGSDMIVFVKKIIKANDKEEMVIVPFARDGQYLQRFDMDKVQSGMKKDALIMQFGPEKLSVQDLYAFRSDYDPGRLILAKREKMEQVGFAILRPGGHYGKNILYMDGEIPDGFKADNETGSGTNTGIIYNLLRRVHKIPQSSKFRTNKEIDATCLNVNNEQANLNLPQAKLG